MRNPLRERNITEHAVLLTELPGADAKRLLAEHIEQLIHREVDLSFRAGLYRRVKRLEDNVAGSGRV